MIARFRILLPFTLYIRSEDKLTPHEFEYSGYHITIYPPFRAHTEFAAILDSLDYSFVEVGDLLKSLPEQTPTDAVLIDEKPSIQTNLLQIDFRKQEFDRRKEREENITEPPLPLMINLVNSFLRRVRSITQGFQIKEFDGNPALWSVEYLSDDGKELPSDPQLFRRTVGSPFRIEVCPVKEANWEAAKSLPIDYSPPTWETLLLDAEAALPEIGASIVLAYAALETLIAFCLDQLAISTKLDPKIWDWVKRPGEDWRKEPSVTDQFDTLLRIFTGKSLKDETELWKAFQNLKNARNSFVHEGEARIGNRKITNEHVLLVARTRQILYWIEALLPPHLQRPKLILSSVSVTKPVVKPSTN